jgi:rubrerythrin
LVFEATASGRRGSGNSQEELMAIDFNADEVFEMAEQIETNGAAFYRKAAEQFEDPQKELLLTLASMEDKHLEIFRQMRSDLSADAKKSTVYDPEGEAAAYLKAFADGHIFDTSVKPADRLKGGETLPDILRMSIGIEKDSVVFYTGLRHLVPERLGKEKIEGIIGEEMKHITILNRELSSAV